MKTSKGEKTQKRNFKGKNRNLKEIMNDTIEWSESSEPEDSKESFPLGELGLWPLVVLFVLSSGIEEAEEVLVILSLVLFDFLATGLEGSSPPKIITMLFSEIKKSLKYKKDIKQPKNFNWAKNKIK